MEDLAGRQFGPYHVVAPLGEGGMAAVYQAYQPSVDRHVALKVLSRYFTSDPQFLERFRREAKVVAQLQHPHILPVFDFGESDSYAFLVMPFVKRGTLAELLTGSPVSLEVTARVIRQVCEALDYAHSKGIVHRDIKPSNILIDERGNCLVADFGLARMAEGATKLTVTGTVLGTPAYMSPEQAAGKDIGPHSDIYSVGIVLYEMLTGRVPFHAETPIAVAIKHLNDPLPPPRSLNPALTTAIEAVVLKALARSKKDRFVSGEALVASLTAALQSMQQVGTAFLVHDQAASGLPSEMTHVLPQPAQLTPRFSQPALSPTPTGIAQQGRPVPVRTEQRIDSSPARDESTRTWWIGLAVAVVLVVAASTAMLLKPASPDPAAVGPTPSQPEPATATPASTSSETSAALALRAELDLWDAIKDSRNASAFEDYLKRYPRGRFRQPAEERVRAARAALAVPAVAPEPAKPRPAPASSVDARRPGETRADPSVPGVKWAYIPAGTFEMGCTPRDSECDLDESPRHSVRLTRAFELMTTEVTVAMVRSTGRIVQSQPAFSRDDHPVVNINWDDATALCRAIGGRLPTEAEWEYAARGGTRDTKYPWGDESPSATLGSRAGARFQSQSTIAVGSYAPNGYELHDMAGNVSEWVFAASGVLPVLRGGSWTSSQRNLRVSHRSRGAPDVRAINDGVRCARDISQSPASAASPVSGAVSSDDGRRTRSDPRIAGIEWALIPAGTFEMGCTPGDNECTPDESPRHGVRLTRAFELMTTEVTVAMARVVGRTVQSQPAGSRDDHPVVNINWDDATELCRAIGGRLPTEAEWEYAARGGARNSKYPWGNERPVATSSARNGARFRPDDSTISAANYASNGFGLFDMAGNVWEWVVDWFGPYGNGAQTDPRGPVSGLGRVARGGSWAETSDSLRLSTRISGGEPHGRFANFGVRCARDISQ
jgi:formylglycine-generating enzyme required for sulfatase activity/serine/threonine protein kinase